NSIGFDASIRGGHYHLATVSALLGEKSQAINSLEHAIRADRNYCYVVDQDKDFDNVRPEVEDLLRHLTKEAQPKADRKFILAREELADRRFVGVEEINLEKHIMEVMTKAQHLIGNKRYFDYLNAMSELGVAHKLIDEQKQNESKRREAKDQVKKSFDRLSAEADALKPNYEGEKEVEFGYKIDAELRKVERLISQESAPLEDYRDAENALNDVSNLIET